MLVKDIVKIASVSVVYFQKDLCTPIKSQDYEKGAELSEQDGNAQVFDIYADNGVCVDAVY